MRFERMLSERRTFQCVHLVGAAAVEPHRSKQGSSGCGTFSDSPDFKPDGTWDGKTRRIGVNARLFDDFEAATAPVVVIDGRNLW